MTNNQYNKKSTCYTQVTDGLTKRQNLQAVSEAIYRLMNYRRFLASARGCSREATNPRLHEHLARRAFMAEADTRTVLKIGIDTLNILRDFGELDLYITYIRDKHTETMFSSAQIEMAFSEVRKIAGKLDSGIDTSFLVGICEEVLKMQDQHRFDFSASGDNIVLQFDDQQIKSRKLLIKPGLVPWQTPTISSSRFFNGNQAGITATLSPVVVEPDCHHEAQKIVDAAVKSSFDVYGSMLGQFAMARELMYHHARKVDEMGIGYFNGNSPLVAGIILTIIAAIAIVVAVYYSHGEANIVCGTDQDGRVSCEDVNTSSSQLQTSYAATLVGVAFALSGITCAAMQGNCTLQNCPVLPIQG